MKEKVTEKNNKEMQSTCGVALPSFSYPFSFPNHIYSALHHPKPRRTRFTSLSLPNNTSHSQISNLCLLTLTLRPVCCCGINQDNDYYKWNTSSNSTQSQRLYHQFYSSVDANSPANQNPVTRNQEESECEEQKECETRRNKGLFTNMWWVDVKAALGQRLNVGAILSSAVVAVKDRHLALPHVIVPDVRFIDWSELHRRGFKGVVFDKDNTITAPYCLTVWGPLKYSLERCKFVFGHDIAVFSNSAGLHEYDHDGSKAKALEGAIGIKVIRHRVKKPAGTAEEIEKHFGCNSSQLIMVGDRPFTDVVFGNRNGFLTILTEPLSLAGEPFIVRQVRKLEMILVNRWFRKGLRPINHNLLPDATKCVKDPQSL